MKYAVIKSGGKQYRVAEGDVIEVDRLKEEKGKISFSEVLLLVNEGNVKIGKPTVTGEKVIATLVDNIKGEMVRVSKYKSKVRYRRTTGFRAYLSQVKIDQIGEKVTKPAVKTVKPATKVVKEVKKK